MRIGAPTSILPICAAVILFAVVLCRPSLAQEKTAGGEYFVLRRSQPPLTIQRVPLQTDLLNDGFTFVARLADLPQPLKEVLPQLLDKDSIEVAGPHSPYERSDVISRNQLPRRRINLAGTSKRACFLLYEHGGYVEGTFLMVADPCTGRSVNVAWLNVPQNTCENTECVRQLLPQARLCPDKGNCE